jgi:hypothetical protein
MSSSKRLNTFLFLFILTLTIFGAGCTGRIGEGPEEQTPLGCNKSKARYFDPKTGTCVSVTSQQQAYILNEYRYLAEYAKNDDPKLTREFQISLARNFSQDELFKLMEALPEAKVSSFNILFSSGRGINPSFKPPVSISEAPAAAVKETETLMKEADPPLEKGVLDKSYFVYHFRVIDTADHLLTWWTDHQSDITVVEPRVNELDKIKHGIPPFKVEH